MSRFTRVDTIAVAVGATSLIGSNADVYDVSMRKKISFQFIRGNHSSGSSVFAVEVSNDGTNFVNYNRLTTNVTNTNAQTDIGVANATLSAAGSAIYFIRPGDHFRYVRGSLVNVTDGNGSIVMSTID